MPLYDADIREVLKAKIRSEMPTAFIVDEFGIGGQVVRCDVAVFTETVMNGFEIKSDADSFARLSRQISEYDKVFDRNTLIVGESKAKIAVDKIPAWWGLMCVDSARNITLLRHAKKHDKRCAAAIVKILWKVEMIAALHSIGAARGWRGRTCPIIRRKLCELFSIDQLSAIVRKSVKQRRESTACVSQAAASNREA